MASLKEINYNIRNLIRGGILSDDERISERQVNFIINYVRANFVKQSLDKNQVLSPYLHQTICLTFELVDPSCCPEIATDCFVLRSTEKIPQILRLNHGLGLIEVAALDGSMSYPLIVLSRARWTKYNKYTPLNKRVFLKNDYLHMLNDEFQEKACMTAIFSDPLAANELSCTPTEDEYPIPDDMIDGLTQHIVQNIARLSLLVNGDEYNDSNGKVLNSFRTGRNDQTQNSQDT